MPGRGPAPKAQRIRPTDDKKRQGEFTVLTPDDVVRGPELPEGTWPEGVIRLYDAMRREAAASLWTPADWEYLLQTMVIASEFYQGETKLGGELRLRLGQFAVTLEARMRMRLLVDSGDIEPESKLEALRRRQRENEQTTRKRRILKAVAKDMTPIKETR